MQELKWNQTQNHMLNSSCVKLNSLSIHAFMCKHAIPSYAQV